MGVSKNTSAKTAEEGLQKRGSSHSSKSRRESVLERHLAHHQSADMVRERESERERGGEGGEQGHGSPTNNSRAVRFAKAMMARRQLRGEA